MRFRKNEGFTLIELLMVILTGTIVTLAATTVLLLGFRIFFQSNRLQEQQNTTRILMTALEDMAAEGVIDNIVLGEDSWKIRSGETALMAYADGTISAGGNAVLENIDKSKLERTGDVLTVIVEIDGKTYQTSIYCRLGISDGSEPAEGSQTAAIPAPAVADTDTPEIHIAARLYGKQDAAPRTAFLDTLLAQQGSTGTILGTEEAFSHWYLTAKEGETGEARWGDDWNADTPWCACFVSWALARLPEGSVAVPQGRARGTQPFWYANVDEFMAYFRGPEADFDWVDMYNNSAAPMPQPGDVIFFDWTEDWDLNPEHVGVVLYAENGVIHTIEGNSYGTVGLRSYEKTDKTILGYGRLQWTQDLSQAEK